MHIYQCMWCLGVSRIVNVLCHRHGYVTVFGVLNAVSNCMSLCYIAYPRLVFRTNFIESQLLCWQKPGLKCQTS